MAKRVHLQDETDLQPLAPQLREPVEDRLPVAVAGKVVVGDEEARDAVGGILAHDLLDVVRRAEARLASLDVDDRAERALERAAAAGVEGRVVAGDALHDVRRQDGRHGRHHVGQVGEIIIDGLRRAGRNVGDQRRHAALAFAGKEDDAETLRLLQAVRQFRQHRQTAGHMEAAQHDRDAGGAEAPRQVERPGELVGLHADEADEALAGGADALDSALHVDDGVALVIGFDVDIDVRSEDAVLAAFGDQAIDAGKAVRRDGRAHPLDDIAVVVIVRRLDQNGLERPSANGLTHEVPRNAHFSARARDRRRRSRCASQHTCSKPPGHPATARPRPSPFVVSQFMLRCGIPVRALACLCRLTFSTPPPS